MTTLQRQLKSLNDTYSLSLEISELLKENKLLLLKGDLGAGKTTLSSMIIKNLTDVENAVSPTFNILKIYENKNVKVYHYDLYRIKYAEELEEIGFYDNLENGVNIIEWPEIIEETIENYNKIIVKIDFIDNITRSVVIKS